MHPKVLYFQNTPTLFVGASLNISPTRRMNEYAVAIGETHNAMHDILQIPLHN